jgi:hypothetical protein
MELIKWEVTSEYPEGFTLKLSKDEAINLYEALLLSKRMNWATDEECENIRVEIY